MHNRVDSLRQLADAAVAASSRHKQLRILVSIHTNSVGITFRRYRMEAIMTDYLPPLDKLLTLGKPPGRRGWFRYLDHGVGPEHIPELKRMLLDPKLNEAEGGSSLVWAPLHAW